MKAVTPVSLNAAHLLIVDDSAEEQHLLREMLHGDDFQFSAATSGEEALQIALRDSPDMVLLNLQTAGMDALEVERALRRHPQTEDIPVLLLGTAKHLNDHPELLRSENIDYVLRPFSLGQLLDKVHAQLRLAMLLRESGRRRTDASARQVRADWDLIARAKRQLDKNLANIRRAGDIAQAVSVSERRLSQAFQTCLGMSTMDYIRRERMRKAKFLLTHTTQSIRSIATAVGFSSAANFSTAFNNWVGVSPSVFRSQALNSAMLLDRTFK